MVVRDMDHDRPSSPIRFVARSGRLCGFCEQVHRRVHTVHSANNWAVIERAQWSSLTPHCTGPIGPGAPAIPTGPPVACAQSQGNDAPMTTRGCPKRRCVPIWRSAGSTCSGCSDWTCQGRSRPSRPGANPGLTGSVCVDAPFLRSTSWYRSALRTRTTLMRPRPSRVRRR